MLHTSVTRLLQGPVLFHPSQNLPSASVFKDLLYTDHHKTTASLRSSPASIICHKNIFLSCEVSEEPFYTSLKNYHKCSLQDSLYNSHKAGSRGPVLSSADRSSLRGSSPQVSCSLQRRYPRILYTSVTKLLQVSCLSSGGGGGLRGSSFLWSSSREFPTCRSEFLRDKRKADSDEPERVSRRICHIVESMLSSRTRSSNSSLDSVFAMSCEEYRGGKDDIDTASNIGGSITG